MTACNKIDSIVKEDGSTEELLPTEKVLKPKCKVPTLKQKRAIIVLCFLFALLVAGATVFLVLHFINRPVEHRYKEPIFRCGTTYVMNGEMEKGEMEFNTTDQTEKVITKNTEAKIDGLEGKTVVKLTDPDNEEICILRDDLKLGRAGPPILPRKELLAQFMQLNETLEVQMDDDVWFAYPDSDPTLPPTLSDMCEGKSLYGLSPVSDADYQLMADYTEDKFEDMFDYFDNLTMEGDVDYEKSVERRSISEKNYGDYAIEDSDNQLDNDLACCSDCKRPYMRCNNICVPQRTKRNSYSKRNCEYLQCFPVLPCAWWNAHTNVIM